MTAPTIVTENGAGNASVTFSGVAVDDLLWAVVDHDRATTFAVNNGFEVVAQLGSGGGTANVWSALIAKIATSTTETVTVSGGSRAQSNVAGVVRGHGLTAVDFAVGWPTINVNNSNGSTYIFNSVTGLDPSLEYLVLGVLSSGNGAAAARMSASKIPSGYTFVTPAYASGTGTTDVASSWAYRTVSGVSSVTPGSLTSMTNENYVAWTLAIPAAAGASTPVVVADTAAATDTITTTLATIRTAADVAAASDSVTTALAADRSIADTAAAMDTVLTTVGLARTSADVAGATDAVVVLLELGRGSADVAAAQDTVAVILDALRAPTDVAGATDALSTALDAPRTVADTAAASDAVTLAVGRTVADTAAASDAVTLAQGLVRELVDAAAGSDTLSLGIGRVLADVASGTDAAAVVADTLRLLEDVATASDAVLAELLGDGAVTVGDTAAATDIITTVLAATRTTADVAAAADALTRTVAAVRALTDVAPATDAIALAFSGVRVLADTAAAVDAVAVLLETVRVVDLVDVAGAIDQVQVELSSAAAIEVKLADVAGAVDAVLAVLSQAHVGPPLPVVRGTLGDTVDGLHSGLVVGRYREVIRGGDVW